MSTEPVTDPTKRSFWRLSNFLLISTPLFVAAIGWAGSKVSDVWSEYRSLVTKVTTLEDDRSKWASLAELHEKQVKLERDTAVNQNDIEWMRWAVQQKLTPDVKTAKPPTGPVDLPPPLPLPPSPVPLPPKIDPDQYRKMQQHRYPNEPSKK